LDRERIAEANKDWKDILIRKVDWIGTWTFRRNQGSIFPKLPPKKEATMEKILLKFMAYFPYLLIGVILAFALLSELLGCKLQSDAVFLPTFGIENVIRILG
jgi:hypothetical protein